jgi:hypothetical protein
MLIVGLVLAFALVYPRLCALAGFNPDSADALDEIVNKFAPLNHTQPSPLRIVQVLYVLSLACGPVATMLLTLLFVTWIFTQTEFDPKTKDPMAFPARLFTLPVSTPFLFWWLLLAGQAGVVVLYESWIHFVRLPHLEVLAPYQNCFGWMTLLALAQGIVWALAAWPRTRMLILSATLYSFALAPARRDIFESPFVLPPLFILGVVLARAGLQKMRHGQWQGWTWQWPFARQSARAELRGPKRFASPAQAQLWFEWRRFACRLCFYAAALALVPVAIHLLARLVGGLGPVRDGTLLDFTVYVAAVPLFLHFCFAVAPGRADQSFLMIRPITNGGMMMASLKAAVMSTILSWAVVLAALCAMPMLGDFHAVEQSVSAQPGCRAAIVLGLIFLTWRLVAVNLCFVLYGNRWLANIPGLMCIALWLGGMSLAWLSRNGEYWNGFMRLVPGLLAGLVAVKFLLALLAFRVSLQRGLIAPSSAVGYLSVWTLLLAVLLVPTLILFHGNAWILPASLGIILLTPLARIGFCPIALAWSRHA